MGVVIEGTSERAKSNYSPHKHSMHHTFKVTIVMICNPASIRDILRRNLVKYLMIIGSLTGFVIQVTQVSKQFFKYTTTTDVTFIRSNNHKLHSVAACIRYADIIDRSRLNDCMRWYLRQGQYHV